MKIIYQPNPLNTKVILSAEEEKILFLKIKYAEIEDKLFEVHFLLTNNINNINSHAEALKAADPNYYMVEDDSVSPIDQRSTTLKNAYIGALQDPHNGDCVQVACSCMKCIAENLLEINTIPRIKADVGGIISRTFIKLDTNDINAVIEYLEDFSPVSKSGDPIVNTHPYKSALEYLKRYKEKHNF